jgi:hypothetical protein
LMIIPVLLCDGLRLFDNSGAEKRWHLKNVVAYKHRPPLRGGCMSQKLDAEVY